jgi:AhpC/TSA family
VAHRIPTGMLWLTSVRLLQELNRDNGLPDLRRQHASLFLTGGALLAVGVRRAFRDSAQYRGKISGSILAVLSAILFAFFVFGVNYFSKQIPAAGTAIGVGQKAPAFVLLNTAGKQVSSTDLLKNHRGLVLIFYRGYW